MAWSTFTDMDTTIDLPLKFWADLRLYSVQQTVTQKTRQPVTENRLQYNLALACINTGHNQRAVELMKYDTTINGRPPETLAQQAIASLQAAIYPYMLVFDTKNGDLLDIQNFGYVTSEWHNAATNINAQCHNKNVALLIGKMAANITSKDVFLGCIKKDLLLQAFFLPVHNKPLDTKNTQPWSVPLHHELLGPFMANGKLAVKNTDGPLYEINFTAEHALTGTEEMAIIGNLLLKHYPPHLLQPVTGKTLVTIIQHIRADTGMVSYCNMVITISAGDYLCHRTELTVNYTGNKNPQPIEGATHLRTFFLQETIDIII